MDLGKRRICGYHDLQEWDSGNLFLKSINAFTLFMVSFLQMGLFGVGNGLWFENS